MSWRSICISYALFAALPCTMRAQAIRRVPGMPEPMPLAALMDTRPHRSAEECVGVDSLSLADTSAVGRSPVEVWTIVRPPLDVPRSMRGKQFEIRLRVTALAEIDSVEITGPKMDSGYRKEFIKGLKQHRFRPAIYKGCRVSGWYPMKFTF